MQLFRRRALALDDRMALVVFRLVIFLLLNFFLLYSPSIEREARLLPFALLGLYLLSDVALLRAPREVLKRTAARGAILLLDIAVISAVIYQSHGADTDLYLVYFLVIFMSSLDARLHRSFLTASVACAVYVALALRAQVDWTETAFLLRIPFFYLVSFFGTFMAAQTRDDCERQEQRGREQAEASARRSAVGRLAREIARELSGPLAVVEGLTATLKKTPDGQDDPRQASIETLSFVARRCATLLERFLMLTTDKVSPFARLDLNDAVRAAVLWLQERKQVPPGLEIELELAPGLRTLRGDKPDLVVAIANLIENAVDAMPKGGTLTVRTRMAPGADGQPTVTLDVLDTGVGIPEFARSRIFDPFFTTKRRYQRAGLGLCFVSAIVERHHGQIAFETKPGKGSRFSVSFKS